MKKLSDDGVRRSVGLGVRFQGGGFVVGPLASSVVENAEARARLSMKEGDAASRFVPRCLTKASSKRIQAAGAREHTILGLDQLIADLHAAKPGVVRNAAKRELLQKIDGAKELSDAEKNKLRQRVETASK